MASHRAFSLSWAKSKDYIFLKRHSEDEGRGYLLKSSSKLKFTAFYTFKKDAISIYRFCVCQLGFCYTVFVILIKIIITKAKINDIIMNKIKLRQYTIAVRKTFSKRLPVLKICQYTQKL